MAETSGYLQIPGWTAQTGRLAHVSSVINQSANSALTALQVRSGVLPGPDLVTNSFAVATKSGGANMSVDVYPGLAIIQGTESATQGAYVCWASAKVNRTVAAADATFTRRDLVILRVQDSFYSTANNLFTIEVVTGSPSASPVDPALPVNSFAIGRIVVAPGVTSITLNTNLWDIRSYTSAKGGSLLVSDVSLTGGTETNLKPTNPEPYQIILEKDNSTSLERLKIWIPALSRWDIIGIGVTDALTGSYTPTLGSTGTAPTLGTGSIQTGRWARISHDVVMFTAFVQFGTSGIVAGTGNYTMSLPFAGATITTSLQVGIDGWYQGGATLSYPLGGTIASGASTALMYLSANIGGNAVTAGNPAAPASGTQITISGVYRIATA